MFLVNQHPALVLFDSGASHSFISQQFASEKDQKISTTKNGYSTGSAGANIATNQVVWNVNLSIEERDYTIDLIVLPSLGLDVILCMKWMSGHGVTMDTANTMI
jgi:hypothetical protein